MFCDTRLLTLKLLIEGTWRIAVFFISTSPNQRIHDRMHFGMRGQESTSERQLRPTNCCHEVSYFKAKMHLWALCIICEDGDYMLSLIKAGFDTLEARREQLTERFFRSSVLPETSCMHYVLRSKRDVSVTSRLRHARTLELLKCRTVKFRHSFIPYCLDHYV